MSSNLNTASYIRAGEGKSLNALLAESDGTLTGSAWARKIGKNVSAADIEKAIPVGEWHHTGLYARRTRYYSPEEVNEAMEKILGFRDARLSERIVARVGTIRWEEWHRVKKGRFGRLGWERTEHSFTGEIEIKGDWALIRWTEDAN